MASRDVELILKAKNEASAAIKSVSDALDALAQSQSTAGTSAEKAQSDFERLTSRMATLDSQVKGLSNLGKVSEEFAAAEAAVGRLSAKLDIEKAALAGVSAQQEVTGSTLAQLRENFTRANEAMSAEKAALDGIGAVFKQLGAESRSAGSAVSEFTSKLNASEGAEARIATQLGNASAKLAELQTKMSGAAAFGDTAGVQRFASQIETAENRVAALTAKLESQRATTAGYRAMLDAATTTAASLARTQADLNIGLGEAKARFEGAKGNVAAFGKEISAVEATERNLAAEMDKASVKVERANSEFQKGTSDLAEFRTIVDQGAAKLRVFATSEDTVAKASATAGSELQRVSAALKSFTSTGSLNISVPEKSLENYRSLMRTLAETKGAVDGARKELAALDATISESGVPTQKMISDQNELRASIRSLEAEYRLAAAAINTFAGRTNGSFAAFESAAAKIRAPENSLESLNATLQSTRARFESMSAVLTKMGQELAATGGKSKEIESNFEAMRASTAQAEAEFNRAAEAVSRFRNQGSGSFLQLESAIKAIAPASASMSNGLSQAATETVRTSGSLRSLISSILSYVGATQSGSGAGLSFASSIKSIYGESRQALSIMQRLRGEVLGYIAAYAGIQGVISGLQSVVAATRTLEAATNRLGVVNNQSLVGVNDTIDRLRQRSMYLGQSFSTVTDEYSKFAIAAKEANFENSATDKIFNSVAVAARVNKLSVDQLKGVYLALTQSISKGKIQSEELRRQLGDRLPGAFNLMAKAIGVSAGELDNMMKKGEVLADQSTMLKFAEQLIKSFGSQLPEALKTLSTQLDLFGSTSEQVKQIIGEGGFAGALKDLMIVINSAIGDRGARDFFLSIGAAAGRAVDGVRFLAENFDIVRIALTALVSIKGGSVLVSLFRDLGKSAGEAGVKWTSFASGVAGTTFAFKSIGASIDSFDRAMETSSGRAGVFRSAVGGLAAPFITLGAAAIRGGAAVYEFGSNLSLASIKAGVMRAAIVTTGAAVTIFGNATKAAVFGVRSLFAAMGGWTGIGASILTFFAADWLAGFMGKVDDSTKLIDEHKRVIDLVKVAYEQWGNNAEKVGEALKGKLSNDEITKNVRNMGQMYDEAKQKAVSFYGDVSTYVKIANTAEYARAKELREAYGRGTVSTEKFREELQKLYESTNNNSVKVYLEQLLELARGAEVAQQRIDAAKDAAKKAGTNLPDFAEKTRIEKFVDWLEKAGSILLEIGKWAAGIVAALAVLGTVGGKIAAGWASVLAVFRTASGLAGGILAVFRAIVTVVGGVAAGFGALEIAFVALVAAIAYGATQIILNWDAVKAWFSNFASEAGGYLTSVWNAIVEGASNAWSTFKQYAFDAWNAVASAAQSAASTIQSYFSSALDWIIDKAKGVASAIANAVSAISGGSSGSSSNGTAQTLATGGRVVGPGSETSDSVDAKLSVNEWVMQAKAVRFYGASFMSRLNSMSVPRFAGGGGAVAASAIAGNGVSSASDQRPVNLTIGDKTYALSGQVDVVRELVNYTKAASARSAGRQPNWNQGKR